MLGEKCSLVSSGSPCGDTGTCHVHSRRPVPSSGLLLPHQITCSCGGQLPPDNCTLSDGDQVNTIQNTISLESDLGMVTVIDHISVMPDTCKTSSLVAAVSYWCQGKPGGCNIQEEVWRSVVRDCKEEKISLSVRWHYEEDYNSREIPCPSYGHGALEKKFSEYFGLQPLD